MRSAIALCLVLVLAIACAGAGDTAPSPTPGVQPSPAFTGIPSPGGSAIDAAEPVSGSPIPSGLEEGLVIRVVDGDTIDVLVGGQNLRVRYIGIDTPETVDPRRPVECFGREATERNRGLVSGEAVGLERDVSEVDVFGRLLRYVWVNGKMVNAELVAEGYATASAFPPDVKYADLFASLQGKARTAGWGLWGACATPETAPTPGGPCDYSGSDEAVIKGNISLDSGERIYHVPGGDYYEQTVVSEEKGERWFCTEAEAEDAGWRKSRR